MLTTAKTLKVINLDYYEHASNVPIEESNFNFVNADFIALNNFNMTFEWEKIFRNKSLSEMYTCFKNILFEGIELFVPIFRKKKPNKLPWQNKRLKNIENVKNKACFNRVY